MAIRHQGSANALTYAKLDAEMDALSKSLGKTSIAPEDDVMASRSLRNADHEEDIDSTQVDASTRTLVNPEALELATRLSSIDQERAGLSLKKGSALRFLLWGVEPFIEAVVVDLNRLAYKDIPEYLTLLRAARLLAGADDDDEDVDPSEFSCPLCT